MTYMIIHAFHTRVWPMRLGPMDSTDKAVMINSGESTDRLVNVQVLYLHTWPPKLWSKGHGPGF